MWLQTQHQMVPCISLRRKAAQLLVVSALQLEDLSVWKRFLGLYIQTLTGTTFHEYGIYRMSTNRSN